VGHFGRIPRDVRDEPAQVALVDVEDDKDVPGHRAGAHRAYGAARGDAAFEPAGQVGPAAQTFDLQPCATAHGDEHWGHHGSTTRTEGPAFPSPRSFHGLSSERRDQ
jgi:hypothetical protein